MANSPRKRKGSSPLRSPALAKRQAGMSNPPKGKSVRDTFIHPPSGSARDGDIFESDALRVEKVYSEPGYTEPAPGTAHPDSVKYPNHKFISAHPAADGETVEWLYARLRTRRDQEITREFGGGQLDVLRSSAFSTLIPDQGINVIESEVEDLGDGKFTKKTKQLSDTTPVQLNLTAGGSGYTSAPTVVFTGGAGSGAVATATIGFAISAINVTAGGSGYATPPAVQILGGDGKSARAKSTLSFGINSVDLIAGGTGYTSAPTIAFTGGGGSGATATAVLGFGVASIAVTAAGSGYTSPPTVAITGNGTGAGAHAVLGYPIRIVGLTQKGSGYTSAPTVAFTGGGGTAAAATAVLSFAVASFNVTASGSGYTSPPQVSITGGAGHGAAGTAVLGFPLATLSALASATIATGGANYKINDVLTVAGGTLAPNSSSTTPSIAAQIKVTSVNGSGAVTGVFVFKAGNYSVIPTSPAGISGGSGSGATFNLTWSDISLVLTAGGSGYTSAPAIAFTGGGGSGAAATATIDTVVTAVTITAGGSGYTSAPTVVFSGGGASVSAVGAAILGFAVASIVVDVAGSSLSSVPTASFSGGSGSGATAACHVGIFSAAIVSGGTGGTYAVNDILTMVGGTSGTAGQLKVTAVTAGVITAVSINTVGDYTAIPSNPVSVTGGGGTGATFTLTWTVVSIAVTAGGSVYTSAPVVTVTGGVSAHSVLATSGSVKSVTITSGGSGYTSAPTVAFSGGAGTGAAGTTTITTEVVSLTLTSAGSGYTSVPTVGFSGGGGTGAAATASLATIGKVVSITLIAGGASYTSAPSVSLIGSPGSGATATAILASTGVVNNLTLTNAGTGYTSAPTISFSGGGGSGAAATAAVDTTKPAIVSSIVVDAAGAGYTTAPTISFTGGGGSGATATATLLATGSVATITQTANGSGYTSIPTVSFSGGGGTGAAGQADLQLTGVVASITLISGGDSYTIAPTIAFSGGGGGTGATATTVFASTGSVVSLSLTATGTYSFAPSVSFSGGGGGSGAAAVYVVPVSQWPTLTEIWTDPVTSIVVDVTKTIVPALTGYYPALGYVDIKAYEKWRSIQIVSKVDLHTLPAPVTFGSTQDLSLPATLVGVTANWSSQGGTTQSVQYSPKAGFTVATTRVEAVVKSGVLGAIEVLFTHGYRGVAQAEITRGYFFGPPQLFDIPTPTKIIPVTGTATMIGTEVTFTQTRGTGADADNWSTLDSNEGSMRSESKTFGPFLSGGFIANNSSFIGSSSLATITSQVGDVWGQTYGVFMFLPSPVGNLHVNIPVSTPVAIYSGQWLLTAAVVTKWRFNIYVLEIIRVQVP